MTTPVPHAHPTQPWRSRLLLFAAGINLILLQLFMIREFAISLFSTEIIVLAITVAYFCGYSLGYLLSAHIRSSWVKPWLAAVVVAHLPMLALVRTLSGWCAQHDLEGAGLPLILSIAALGMTCFYTIFLPRAVTAEGASSRGLAWCYSLELAGSATGLGLAMLIGGWKTGALAVLYLAILLVIAWCLRSSVAFIGTLAVLGVGVLSAMPALERASTEYFYERSFSWIDDPHVVFSAHSPYQKIEVLERKGGRSLHLNGLEYFNSSDLESFNFYLSEIPATLAALQAPPRILIVGSGSMSSLHHVAPHAERITTVEIDPLVAEVGRRFFGEYNRLPEVEAKWQLVIDDAKHFLSTTGDRFDLVIIDVPAPWYVQTGLLFTREFYHLVKARLSAGGMLSVYLTESISLKRKRRISSQILAALVSEFDDLYVVDADESPYGFALAGTDLPFDTETIRGTILAAEPGASFRVYTREQMVRLISDTRPASYDNLDIVWDLNLWALPYDDDDD